MTTSQSPLRVLKRQADGIARALKAAERGEKIGAAFEERMAAARGRECLTFVVAMDDKLLKISMTWASIKDTSEVGIAEYILKQMRGSREATH